MFPFKCCFILFLVVISTYDTIIIIIPQKHFRCTSEFYMCHFRKYNNVQPLIINIYDFFALKQQQFFFFFFFVRLMGVDIRPKSS